MLLIYGYRDRLFPQEWDAGVRLGAANAIVALGWKLARSAGRALRPWLFQRLEPATAGSVGFLIRLTTTAVVVVRSRCGSRAWPRARLRSAAP